MQNKSLRRCASSIAEFM